LKPALCGGFAACEKWIALASSKNIGWWATSALESDVGLNAIVQWVATKDTLLPQGLGLGNLYTNNVGSPLELRKEALYYNPDQKWKEQHIQPLSL
ncbi:MAG: o-succinylbenzoate synthase, partial [Bacteroidales bacterium]|nr:o-succinylbenzoate synthase [Bacteroidales bacterium]